MVDQGEGVSEWRQQWKSPVRRPVSIRGVGVPNGQGVEHAHIVLLLAGTSATIQKPSASRMPDSKVTLINSLP